MDHRLDIGLANNPCVEPNTRNQARVQPHRFSGSQAPMSMKAPTAHRKNRKASSTRRCLARTRRITGGCETEKRYPTGNPEQDLSRPRSRRTTDDPRNTSDSTSRLASHPIESMLYEHLIVGSRRRPTRVRCASKSFDTMPFSGMPTRTLRLRNLSF